MTKTWTALAYLSLVDEGKVALDEPVRSYLPGFRVADPEVSARVTARHLLYHTSGIEESFGDPGEGGDVYARMVANIAEAPQVHPLGRTHGYSAALGYAILARVMEVVEGASWDDILRYRVLEPLGQADTNSWRTGIDPARAATGHLVRSLDEGPIRSPVEFLPRAYGPGGTVTSTVRDVLQLARVILDGADTRVVSRDTVSTMLGTRVAVPDPYLFGPEWALGLIVCDWRGETVYASDGSTIGQHSRLRILPERGLAIALLANGGPSDSFYRTVFNEILTEFDAPAIPEPPRPDPALRLDPSRYVGRYQRPGAGFEVTAEEGRLFLVQQRDPVHARFLGQPGSVRYELLPISPTHFLMPPAGPLEDPQTAALFDFTGGPARYLHTNCRIFPRAGG
jgi:CubicO group peptidase (beta-lactamase class C family)